MKRIEEDIKKRSFHSVYLLYGEEDYLIRLYRDKIKKAVLDGADEMNYSYFYGNAIDLAEVKSIADTLPFFQEYRVIVLEDTRFFKTANDFSDYLAGMPDTTILVFTEKEVDKRNKLYKYVKKNGLAVELNAMSIEETRIFIGRKLKNNGKVIRESTVNYFLEQVDNSLLNIDNELEKLIAYTNGREEITREDVDSICSVLVTGQIFKLMDAVAGKKKQEAVKLYHDLLELKESPMSILRLLVRNFNILLQIKSLPPKLSKQQIAQTIGIPPFSVGKYQMQCKNFSTAQLKEMLTMCVETEYNFKRGNIKEQIGVELLLVEFMQAS
ncbi:MAG: DNA polymerase III subunit delta [Butyribacter sp.]|nr:DNA polymerase III subunit delta [bacterium]MDY3853866.1 DNA polymerase III subunit delta [Butyribacter sp.]